MEENMLFIKEEDYQEIKEKLNKENDYFKKEEITFYFKSGKSREIKKYSNLKNLKILYFLGIWSG